MGKEVDNLLLFKGVAQNGSGNILPPHMDGGVFLFRLYFVEILREDSIELVLQFLQRVRIPGGSIDEQQTGASGKEAGNSDGNEALQKTESGGV